MRSYLRYPIQLAALITFSTLAATYASAQDSKIPTFDRENPKAAETETAAPRLKPVAPDPTVVIRAGGGVDGTAEVVPPAPRIVTRSNGVVSLKGLSTGQFKTRTVAAVSPLKVNSSYGIRHGRRHTGIDFDGDLGQSVGAPVAGVVAFAGVKRGYGNVVVLDHGNSVATYYAHLSAMYVMEGQSVTAGQIIGAIGSTGRSTGPHLHYEVRISGQPINPSSLISFENGVALVDGRPLGGGDVVEAGDEEPAEAPAADTESRPRRVEPVVSVPGVIYVGESKMSVQ